MPSRCVDHHIINHMVAGCAWELVGKLFIGILPTYEAPSRVYFNHTSLGQFDVYICSDGLISLNRVD